MKTSQTGIDLICSFEGCKLTSYRDIVGILTIGYGHTGEDVQEDQTITQDDAVNLLKKDLNKFEDGVNNLVQVDLNQNQFDALVSFSYNLGLHTLGGSTLLKDINNGDFDSAANEFLKWDHAGGKVVQGLLRRRQAEKDLFVS